MKDPAPLAVVLCFSRKALQYRARAQKAYPAFKPAHRWFGLVLGFALPAFAAFAADADWPEYLGGPERNHYSTLAQITPANVAQLKVAWEYHTGDPGEMQHNPLIVAGVLYGMTAAGDIFALDGATGREMWRYTERDDPPASRTFSGNRILRGLTYWADGTDKRILFTAGSWLCALDATNGKRIATFGECEST